MGNQVDSNTAIRHLNKLEAFLDERMADTFKENGSVSPQVSVSTVGQNALDILSVKPESELLKNKIEPIKPKKGFFKTVLKVLKTITGVRFINRFFKSSYKAESRAHIIDDLSQIKWSKSVSANSIEGLLQLIYNPEVLVTQTKKDAFKKTILEPNIKGLPEGQTKSDLENLLEEMKVEKGSRRLLEKASKILFVRKLTQLIEMPQVSLDKNVKSELLELINTKNFDKACHILKEMLYVNKYRAKVQILCDKHTNTILNKADILALKDLAANEPVSKPEMTKAYEKLLEVKSKITTYKWLSKLEGEGEISEYRLHLLSKSIKNNDKELFAKEILNFVNERMAIAKQSGLKIVYYQWNELIQTLKQNGSDNPFVDFAMAFGPIRYYDKLMKPLQRVSQKMVETSKDIQEIESKDPEIKNSIERINEKMDKIESTYMNIFSNDIVYVPHLRYQLLKNLGNLRSKLREVNDQYEAIIGIVKGQSKCLHKVCGCHYAFEGEANETAKGKIPVVPKQQIKVTQYKLDIEKTLKTTKAEIKVLETIDKKQTEISINEQKEQPSLEVSKQVKIDKLKKKEKTLTEELDKINAYEQRPSLLANELGKKKSVFIATCSYGTGHNMAAEAVAKYLGPKGVHISAADFSKDVLLDTQVVHNIGKVFGKDWSSPDCFNFILKKQMYRFHNIWRKVEIFARKVFCIKGYPGVASANPSEDSTTKRLIRERLLIEMPDQIVTVYHMDLNPIIEVAKELGIPVVHIATDFDIKATEPFETKNPDYDHFKVMVPFENQKILSTTSPLKKDQIAISGAPVRPEFLNKLSAEQITALKKERGLDPDTKVVVIMGGGGGQAVPYPELLAASSTWDEKTHVIVIAGSNTDFAKQLKINLKKEGKYLRGSNSNVTIEIAKDPANTNTDRSKRYFLSGSEISNLMDMADTIVTKPGGLSCFEALYKGTPALFDHRVELFEWEEDNVKIVKKAGRGLDNCSLKNFEEDLHATLKLGKDFEGKGFKTLKTDDFFCKAIVQMQKKAEADSEIKKKQSSYRLNNPDQAYAQAKSLKEYSFTMIPNAQAIVVEQSAASAAA